MRLTVYTGEECCRFQTCLWHSAEIDRCNWLPLPGDESLSHNTGWKNWFLWTTDWGLQGDTLAPYIFSIVLDYAMTRVLDGREEDLGFKIDRRRSRRHHPVLIIDTGFAYNIAITTAQMYQDQEMLASVELEAAKIGLRLNSKKTEVMHFNQGGL